MNEILIPKKIIEQITQDTEEQKNQSKTKPHEIKSTNRNIKGQSHTLQDRISED